MEASGTNGGAELFGALHADDVQAEALFALEEGGRPVDGGVLKDVGEEPVPEAALGEAVESPEEALAVADVARADHFCAG